MDTIGSRIRFLRQLKKLSMNELSKIVNISNANISDIENNKVMPGSAALISLCNFFNVSSDWILFGNEPIKLEDDEIECLNIYRQLTEREKGQVDLFFKQLLRERPVGQEKEILSS